MYLKFTVLLLAWTLLSNVTAAKKNDVHSKKFLSSSTLLSVERRNHQISPQKKRGLYGIEAANILSAPPLPSFHSITSTIAPHLVEVSSVGPFAKSISPYPELYIKPSSTPVTPYDLHHVSPLPTALPAPLPPHGVSPHPYPPKEITITKEVPLPYLVHVEKKVPYPVYIHVPQPYPVTVEKHVPYEVRVPVEHPVPKPYPVPVDRHILVPVEKHVPYPVKVPVDRPYPVHVPVEKPVPYPVHVIVDRPVPRPYPVTVEKHVPYPVEVEKRVPYPVEKHVPYPVKVPVPVPVEKHYSSYPVYEVENPSHSYHKYSSPHSHYSSY